MRRYTPYPPYPHNSAWDLIYKRPGDSLRRAATAARHNGDNPAPWLAGLAGEEKVAAIIDGDDEWQALHSVPIGSYGSDIDHLIVGPGGTYTINTKHFTHPLVCNGMNSWVDNVEGTYLDDACTEARKASDLLSSALHRAVTVHPLIVATLGGVQRGTTPSPVTVLDITELHEWLTHHPVTLTRSDAADIFTAARCFSTWQHHTTPDDM